MRRMKFVACVLLCIVGCAKTPDTSQPSQTSSPPPNTQPIAKVGKPEDKPLEITGTQLYAAYHKNLLQYEKEWNGRKVIMKCLPLCVATMKGTVLFWPEPKEKMVNFCGDMFRNNQYRLPVYFLDAEDYNKIEGNIQGSFTVSGILAMGPSVKEARIVSMIKK